MIIHALKQAASAVHLCQLDLAGTLASCQFLACRDAPESKATHLKHSSCRRTVSTGPAADRHWTDPAEAAWPVSPSAILTPLQHAAHLDHALPHLRQDSLTPAAAASPAPASAPRNPCSPRASCMPLSPSIGWDSPNASIPSMESEPRWRPTLDPPTSRLRAACAASGAPLPNL